LGAPAKRTKPEVVNLLYHLPHRESRDMEHASSYTPPGPIHDRPIAFHRAYVTITGSVTAALFLSQAAYWARRTKDADGWFHKTRDEWEAETGLTRREQETARQRLRQLGIIEEHLRDTPARLFYRVNSDRLDELVDAADSPNKPGGNVPTSRAESAQLDGTNRPGTCTSTAKSTSTTETTSESTAERLRSPSAHARQAAKAPRTDPDPKPASPHKALLSRYHEALGCDPPSWPKEAAAAKRLLAGGYTAEQALACYEHFKSQPFWADKHLSLTYIAQQIGAWFAKLEADARAEVEAEAQARAEGERERERERRRAEAWRREDEENRRRANDPELQEKRRKIIEDAPRIVAEYKARWEREQQEREQKQREAFAEAERQAIERDRRLRGIEPAQPETEEQLAAKLAYWKERLRAEAEAEAQQQTYAP
jgi:hypothetical protein